MTLNIFFSLEKLEVLSKAPKELTKIEETKENENITEPKETNNEKPIAPRKLLEK